MKRNESVTFPEIIEEEDEGPTAKRWLVLATVIVINISVAMVWLSFSPVAYKVASYYGADLIVINILSLVFIMSAIPFGIVAIWVMEKYGFRACIWICAWCNCIGSVLRIVSTIESLDNEHKLLVLFVGQFIVACGAPFGTYTPPKLAGLWFPDSQRTMANTIATSANPFGIILTGLISPLFQESDSYYNMRMMLVTYALPSVLGAIMAVTIITTNGPDRPLPNACVSDDIPKVWDGVKEVSTNKMFMLLAVSLGIGIGLFSSFATLMEQILCPWGYNDTMAGLCASVLTASGIIGSLLISPIADRTKKFAEILKSVYFLTAIASILLSLTHDIYMGYWIVAEAILIGFFAFTIYPVGTEIAAECTYPIGTGTSTGIIQFFGQISSIAMILMLSAIGTPLDIDNENADPQCHHNTTSTETDFEEVTIDMRVPMYVCAALATFVSIILAIFFQPTYKRMEAEQRHKQDVYERRMSTIPVVSDIKNSFTNQSFEDSERLPSVSDDDDISFHATHRDITQF